MTTRQFAFNLIERLYGSELLCQELFETSVKFIKVF